MRFMLIIMLLFSPMAWGQRVLNQDSFRINVRPVLNGILSDFYQMISLFPQFPKELILLTQELETLTPHKALLLETCPRTIDKRCEKILTSLRQRLSVLQTHSWNLVSHHQFPASLYLNSISGIRITAEFNTELDELKGYLDNSSYLIAANIPHKRSTFEIIKKLDELNTNLSLAVVEFIPFNYRDDFRHFYFNFVHPIQLNISKNKNYEFLNRNINSLNFTINLLNMNLTKRNKKTPEGMGPYLSVIHNRWNSLLRYYF